MRGKKSHWRENPTHQDCHIEIKTMGEKSCSCDASHCDAPRCDASRCDAPNKSLVSKGSTHDGQDVTLRYCGMECPSVPRCWGCRKFCGILFFECQEGNCQHVMCQACIFTCEHLAPDQPICEPCLLRRIGKRNLILLKSVSLYDELYAMIISYLP